MNRYNENMKKIVFSFFVMVFTCAANAQDNWFMAQTEQAAVASVTATSELVEASWPTISRLS